MAFLGFSFIRIFVKNCEFCFTDFRKAIACLCVTHTAQISTDGKKTLAKEKYITQLNRELFINIPRDLLYYILPSYA